MDFWLPIPRRPDTELTNAALIDVLLDDGPALGPWAHRPTCEIVKSPDVRCTTTDLQFGQEMYTPSGAFSESSPPPGRRPYAGWLYLSAAVHSSIGRESNTLLLELGVTGRPSLAEQIQTAWHALIGYPRFLGWSHQVPFEPGILISADRRQELLRAVIGSVPVLSIVPSAGVSVGNLLTAANVGAEGRLGYGVTPPWSAATRIRGRKVELYAVSAAREDFIAYELVLDQTSTRPSNRVSKEPFVLQYEFGFGARYGRFEMEYRGVTRTREYTTGPTVRPTAVIGVGYRPNW